jgi:hypothetical protein
MTHLCDYHGRQVGSFLKPVDKAIELTYCHPCDDSSSESDLSNYNDLSMDSPTDLMKFEKILSLHQLFDGTKTKVNESHDGGHREMVTGFSAGVEESNMEATLLAPVVKIAKVTSQVG